MVRLSIHSAGEFDFVSCRTQIRLFAQSFVTEDAMQVYHDLVRKVIEEGEHKASRTGVEPTPRSLTS